VLYDLCVVVYAVYQCLEFRGIMRITGILAPQQLYKYKARAAAENQHSSLALGLLQTFVPQVICIESLCFAFCGF
jgi:hypothetical protein